MTKLKTTPAQREAMRRYARSAKGRAAAKRYRQSAKGERALAAAAARYYDSPGGQLKRERARNRARGQKISPWERDAIDAYHRSMGMLPLYTPEPFSPADLDDPILCARMAEIDVQREYLGFPPLYTSEAIAERVAQAAIDELMGAPSKRVRKRKAGYTIPDFAAPKRKSLAEKIKARAWYRKTRNMPDDSLEKLSPSFPRTRAPQPFPQSITDDWADKINPADIEEPDELQP